MANNEVTVNMGRLMAENVIMKVRVTGVRTALLRLRLSVPFLWLAAKVAGVGLEFDLKESTK